MKLYHSSGSPFVRKVRACAAARGLEGRITLVPARGGIGEVEAVNPLDKVPCLLTEDGLALYDSRVICEFLDSIGEGFPMFPDHALRFRALRLQALADGIMDAAVLRRREMSLAHDAARDAEIKRQARKVTQALDVLEHDSPAQHVDIGTISVGCALGYLDFRFGNEDWRGGRDRLAHWYEVFAQQHCMAQTRPS